MANADSVSVAEAAFDPRAAGTAAGAGGVVFGGVSEDAKLGANLQNLAYWMRNEARVFYFCSPVGTLRPAMAFQSEQNFTFGTTWRAAREEIASVLKCLNFEPTGPCRKLLAGVQFERARVQHAKRGYSALSDTTKAFRRAL